MSHQLVYCTVRESKHRVIYVVRVQDEILEPFELENIAELMRDKLAARRELDGRGRDYARHQQRDAAPVGQPLFDVAGAHRAVQCGRQLDCHQSRLLKHDPEKLQTFRIRSCDRTNTWSAIAFQSEQISLYCASPKSGHRFSEKITHKLEAGVR